MAAFVRFGIPHRYIGASTDTKPATAEVGSLCYEYNTGKAFVTYNGADWTEYAPTAYLNDVSAETLTLSGGAGALTFSAAATIVAGSGLTLPAVTLGGAITGNAQTISNANVTIGASRTLDVSAGTLTLAADQISGDKVEGGTINAVTINTLTLGTTLAGADKPFTGLGDFTFTDGSIIATATSDSATLIFKATDDDGAALAQLEVMRLVGANDPYVAFGGSQQNIFYNSGAITIGGNVTFGAGLAIASGAVNGNTLLLRANDTTFLTFTTGATDAMTIANATMSGTWIASGTVTMPALTLGGAIAAGDQSWTGVGDMVFTNGSCLQTGTTSGDYLYLDAYDTNTGPGYAHMITLKAGTDPTVSLGAAGSIKVDSTSLITVSYHVALLNTIALQTGTTDGNYYLFKAIDNDGEAGAYLEVARVVSANDPYFAFGGSQQNLFYNSGAVTFGGAVTFNSTVTMGSQVFAADSGAVTLIDMSVSGDPVDNTEESIALKIDGNTLIKLYSQADSAGAVDTISEQFFYPLQVGTSASPLTLTVATPIFSLYSTCADEGTGNAEPFYVKSTMTGAGGYGARSRFDMYTNVALGNYANALKAYTSFGAAGRVTGLASAFCGELVLSAGTTSGSYAALEAELVAATGDPVGASTSFIYCNAGGTGSTTVIDAQAALFYFGPQLSAGASGFIDTDITAGTHYGGIRIKMPDGSIKYLAVVSA
jgi:hypothetical protein